MTSRRTFLKTLSAFTGAAALPPLATAQLRAFDEYKAPEYSGPKYPYRDDGQSDPARAAEVIKAFNDDVAARSKGRLLMVVFHADWCGPCHTLARTIQGVKSMTNLDFDVLNVDVDLKVEKYPLLLKTTESWDQRGGIPAVALYRDGKQLEHFVGGNISVEDLGAMLAQYAGRKGPDGLTAKPFAMTNGPAAG